MCSYLQKTINSKIQTQSKKKKSIYTLKEIEVELITDRHKKIGSIKAGSNCAWLNLTVLPNSIDVITGKIVAPLRQLILQRLRFE